MIEPRNDLVFVNSSQVGEATLRRFYDEVLEASFPPAELISLTEFEMNYKSSAPDYPGMIAKLDDEPVGGVLGEYSATSGVLLLSYLAVRKDLRGSGIGTDLLSRALPRWRETVQPVAVLAEIEDPRRYTASSFGDPTARARWYDRLGARFLPISYFQPALRPGLPRAPGLLLISLDTDAETIPTNVVTLFLDEYIEACEGAETRRTDPKYLALRAEVVSWGDAVPLRPLSRLNELERSD